MALAEPWYQLSLMNIIFTLAAAGRYTRYMSFDSNSSCNSNADLELQIVAICMPSESSLVPQAAASKLIHITDSF